MVTAQVSKQTGPVSCKAILEGSCIACRRHVDQIRPKYDGPAPVVPLNLQSEVEDQPEEESEGPDIQQHNSHSPPTPPALVASPALPDRVATNVERRYSLRDQ